MKVLGLGLLLVTWLGFSAVVVHGGLGSAGLASNIQIDVRERAEAQLLENRIEWATVVADGRRLSLAGEAENTEERSRAQAAANAWGCGRMFRSDESDASDCASVSAVTLMVPRHFDVAFESERADLFDPPTLSLRGEVPTEEFRLSTYMHAVELFGQENVIDERQVIFGLFFPEMETVQTAGLSTLSNMIRGRFVTSAGTVTLEGDAPAEAVVDGCREEFRALRTEEFVPGEISVSVPEAVAAANGCEADFDELLASGKIRFSEGGDRIIGADNLPDGVNVLERLAMVASDCPSALVQVAAHTDNMGSSAGNRELSHTRALAVIEALRRYGAETTQFVAVGFGDTRPVASNEDDLGRAMNRRMELDVLHPDPGDRRLEVSRAALSAARGQAPTDSTGEGAAQRP